MKAQLVTPELVEELRKIPNLSDLNDEELGWLADHAELLTAEPGELVIREGEPAQWMFIYLEGETDGRRASQGPDAPVFTARASTTLLEFRV